MKFFDGYRIPIWVLISQLLLGSYFFVQYGWSQAAVGLMIRTTARMSVILFLMAFSASAFYFFYKNKITNWLLKNRRYLGISFAASHYIHLISILLMNFAIDKPVFAERGFVIVSLGGLGYVFLTLMALTSTDNAIKKMGFKNWKILHWVGSHYLWVVFCASFIPRALTDVFYIPFAVILILAMAMRILYFVKKRKSIPYPIDNP